MEPECFLPNSQVPATLS